MVDSTEDFSEPSLRPPKLKGTLKRVARNNPYKTLTRTKAATKVAH